MTMTMRPGVSPTPEDKIESWARGWRVSKGRMACYKCPRGRAIDVGHGAYYTGDPGEVLCKPHAESVGVLAPTWAK